MERLQKVMAHAGVDSRRKCEEIITAGRVKVNGEVVTELGTKVSPKDRIEVDNIPIYKEEPRYFVLYKPRNTLSAVSDDKGRPVVVDLLQGVEERIYPVGRLDWDTTGLLLLTNDGDFAHKLMHPSYEIKKVYIAKLDGIPTKQELNRLERGLRIDGEKTAPARARILHTNTGNNTSVVELTVHEGWNHLVKKMFAAIGYNVNKLKRERLGTLDLGNMEPGDYRELVKFERDDLLRLAESKQ